MPTPEFERPGERRHAARILLRALVVTGLVLGGCEAALQLASLAAFGLHRVRERSLRGGEKTILSIGDSFTQGLGASARDRTYPARLEQGLADSGLAAWTVVNGGMAGRDSRGALESLPWQLREFKPAIVYILIGNADFWTSPSPITAAHIPAGDRPGFVWKFRMGLVARIARDRLRARATRDTAPDATHSPGDSLPAPTGTATDLAGVWQAGMRLVEIREDGVLFLDGDTLRWKLLDGQIHFTPGGPAGGGIPMRFTWRRVADTLVLRSVTDDFVQVLIGGVRDDSLLARGMRANAYARQGRHGDMRAELASILAEYDRRGRPDSLRRTILSFGESTGEQAFSETFARSIVATDSSSAWAWRTIAWLEFQHGRRAEAAQAISRAIRNAPDLVALGAFLRIQATISRDVDSLAALRSAIDGYRADHNAAELRMLLRGSGLRWSSRALEEALTDLRATGPERDLIRAALPQSAASDVDEVLVVLEGHYREMIRLIRDAGAIPVMLMYPFQRDELEALQQRVAQETGTSLMPIRPTFDDEARRVGRETLWAADGHPNDSGYALMGRLVVQDAVTRLRSARQR